MARRKRYIKGKVYLINDSLLVKNTKNNRRIVAINNDRNNMHVKRITSLYDKNGKIKDVIPIEKYPDLPDRKSVV